MMEQKSVMWRYIAQEPEVLRQLIASGRPGGFAGEVGEKLEAVYFVAHGSSFNAAVAVSDFLARTAHLRVYAYTPANFCCNASALAREARETTLVAAISQTGTSAGVIKALHYAGGLGFSTLGVTADEASPVAALARWTLPLLCGGEESNAKTKGYSSTLLLLLLLAVHLGRVRGTLAEAEAQAVYGELGGMIDALPETAEKLCAWCERTRFGASLRDLYVLGCGMNFGTAQEGQLKLMETMCIPTMFNDVGEFSHGMHRSITSGSSVLLLKARGAYEALTEETFRYLNGITRHVLLLDAAGGTEESERRVSIACFPRTQSLLLTTLAVQVLSVYAPERVGKDPNRDAHDDFTQAVHTRV